MDRLATKGVGLKRWVAVELALSACPTSVSTVPRLCDNCHTAIEQPPHSNRTTVTEGVHPPQAVFNGYFSVDWICCFISYSPDFANE